MTKSENRKKKLDELVESIIKTQKTISLHRSIVSEWTAKLESQRSEYQLQKMYLKFDEIDEARQEFANAIAEQKP